MDGWNGKVCDDDGTSSSHLVGVPSRWTKFTEIERHQSNLVTEPSRFALLAQAAVGHGRQIAVP